MSKTILLVMSLSVLLLVTTLTQNSYALGDYDFISKWGSFGIEKPEQFSHPQFLTVDSDGNVYVTDLGKKRILKFSSNGKFLTEWGKGGKLPGEFHYPSGITVSNNFVFVADRDLHRIQKFDHDGNFISEWGSKGTYEGQFLFPNRILFANNSVYVVDTGNQRIQKFTTNGEFVSSFGSSGMGKGQFLTAIGITTDSKGDIYVSDRGNDKIEKFDADGNHIKSMKYYGSNFVFSPEGIVIDPNDDIFVINSATDRIMHLKQDDDSFYLNLSERNGPYPDIFAMPNEIAFGINGELFVVDSVMHKILTFATEFYVQPELIEDEDISETDVEISDYVKPEIVAPSNLVVEATGILTHVDFGEPVVSDESGIKTILNNAPVGGLPLGVTTIVWIAFDNAGNSAHSFQTITVNACGKFYSEYNMIHGNVDDDIIHGTEHDDLIFGLDGNDLIYGGNGNDCIFGGSGDDSLYGNNGNDTISGEDGNDILKGLSGNDVIYGNDGHNIVDGGEGHDSCNHSKKDTTINCEF